MIATVGKLARVDDYLHRIAEQLRTKRVNAVQRREILAELKSHLIERIAEFQAEDSPDPVGQALAALGNPVEIAFELAATANLRAASHSFFPTRLLSAAWSMARKFGRGLSLFLLGFIGYTLSLGALITVVMKIILPNRVGLWVGDFGFVWGISPNTANGRELAGHWFIPITAWLASCLPLEPRYCCVAKSGRSQCFELCNNIDIDAHIVILSNYESLLRLQQGETRSSGQNARVQRKNLDPA